MMFDFYSACCCENSKFSLWHPTVTPDHPLLYILTHHIQETHVHTAYPNTSFFTRLWLFFLQPLSCSGFQGLSCHKGGNPYLTLKRYNPLKHIIPSLQKWCIFCLFLWKYMEKSYILITYYKSRSSFQRKLFLDFWAIVKHLFPRISFLYS